MFLWGRHIWGRPADGVKIHLGVVNGFSSLDDSMAERNISIILVETPSGDHKYTLLFWMLSGFPFCWGCGDDWKEMGLGFLSLNHQENSGPAY